MCVTVTVFGCECTATEITYCCTTKVCLSFWETSALKIGIIKVTKHSLQIFNGFPGDVRQYGGKYEQGTFIQFTLHTVYWHS